jgi:hypothetical protein
MGCAGRFGSVDRPSSEGAGNVEEARKQNGTEKREPGDSVCEPHDVNVLSKGYPFNCATHKMLCWPSRVTWPRTLAPNRR